jgi:hypothetical protein
VFVVLKWSVGESSFDINQMGPRLLQLTRATMCIPVTCEINEANSILVVKAAGLAGDIWYETWLYEYDLDGRRQLSKVLVDPSVLPEECAMPERK